MRNGVVNAQAKDGVMVKFVTMNSNNIHVWWITIHCLKLKKNIAVVLLLRYSKALVKLGLKYRRNRFELS